MNEPVVRVAKLCAVLLWSLATILVLAGWGAYVARYADLGLMLATTACVAAAGGGTLSVRCYARRVARLVRLVGNLPTPQKQSGSLRSIRE